MADVRPFHAVRYAQPSPAVVAPPYDVVDQSALAELRAEHPHNVVHLTLAESEVDAGTLYRDWLDHGVLVREESPAYWLLSQDFVGPDGVARQRHGIVVSLRLEPYSSGVVLPHERTHAGPKESRLRLLRSARAQLEPVFLLHEGEAPFTVPARPPELEAHGTQLWRLEDDGAVAAFFAGKQLLMADGHHRYETALSFHEEDGSDASAWMMAVLVSTDDPGLEIFPTHRVFSGRPDIAPTGEPASDPGAALGLLEQESHDRAAAVAYRDGTTALVHGSADELDVELVDQFGVQGISYTSDWRHAVARVDGAAADVAFLLRATRIEDVFERARQGRLLPQKTTYFFPKLVSGLLFHPLGADGVRGAS